MFVVMKCNTWFSPHSCCPWPSRERISLLKSPVCSPDRNFLFIPNFFLLCNLMRVKMRKLWKKAFGCEVKLSEKRKVRSRHDRNVFFEHVDCESMRCGRRYGENTCTADRRIRWIINNLTTIIVRQQHDGQQ